MKPPVAGLLLFLLCLFAASDLCAATLTVTKAADTNDGVCDADCSLREAVAAAVSADTIVFSQLFGSPQTITLTIGQITINKNLTINGTGQNLVTISGNNADRIFFITGGAVTVNLTGMTFRDGDAGSSNGFGGAILMNASRLNVTGATFTNNRAVASGGSAGAAIAAGELSILTLSDLIVVGNDSFHGPAILGTSIDIRDSQVRQNVGGGISLGITGNVERCVISDNTGQGVSAQHLTIIDSTVTNNTGGGVSDGDAASMLTIERCVISGNSRDPTAGGVKSSGMTVIKDTTITNNSALSAGGGISNAGTLYLINSNVSGNTTTSSGLNDGGAGIRNSVGTLFVINSTVSGNTVTSGNPGVGGGIYNLSTPEHRFAIYLINSTIANNTSSGAGGGISINPNGDATLSNTIVAGNNSTGTTQEDVSGTIISNGINLVGNTTGSSGWITGDLLNVNPMLGPLADNGGPTMTHALLSGSPAIDAANNLLAVDPQTQMYLTGDQRGVPRLVGVKTDIGSYESTQTASPVIAGSVTYGNTLDSPSPRFVPNVSMTGAGSPNVSGATLDAGPGQGTYLLTGLGTGSYTVTPSKIGGVNGVSSFDSARIAQHVAGLQTLTGNQAVVADVSGNGTLSSFDAAQIARYAAGLNNSGSSGTWIFMPATRTYGSVTANLPGQDFVALLMGDVSGNWTPF